MEQDSSKKKQSYLHPIKAIIYMVIYMLLFIALPYYLYYNVLPTYASLIPFTITVDMLNRIMTLGAITGIAAFFQNLWGRGTRPHGLFNLIFAGWGIYLTYYFLAGGFSGGQFGILSLSFMGIAFTLNLTIMAYMIIGAGLIRVFAYIYETIR